MGNINNNNNSDNEKWAPIYGYEKEYSVSSYGKVLSLQRKIQYGERIRTVPQKELSFSFDKRGYTSVFLNKNGITQRMLVHRLVAKAFIPNPLGYPIVDHLDCNPQNNNVSNLRWCTQKMNMSNPISKLNIKKREINQKNNSLSKPVVRINKDNSIKIYPSQSEAQRDGYSQHHICNCCKGKAKSHKGFQWMYLSDYKKLTNMSKNALSNTNT